MIKDGYKLRAIAGQNVVIPDADNNLDGALVLNQTGAYIWSLLECETTYDELVDALTSKYDVTEIKAMESVDCMLETLNKYDVLIP